MESNRKVTKVTTLRIDSKLYERLAKIAEAENRSVNGQVLYYVQQGLKDQQHA